MTSNIKDKTFAQVAKRVFGINYTEEEYCTLVFLSRGNLQGTKRVIETYGNRGYLPTSITEFDPRKLENNLQERLFGTLYLDMRELNLDSTKLWTKLVVSADPTSILAEDMAKDAGIGTEHEWDDLISSIGALSDREEVTPIDRYLLNNIEYLEEFATKLKYQEDELDLLSEFKYAPTMKLEVYYDAIGQMHHNLANSNLIKEYNIEKLLVRAVTEENGKVELKEMYDTIQSISKVNEFRVLEAITLLTTVTYFQMIPGYYEALNDLIEYAYDLEL